jgi:SAM-dependent methyltransferase
MSAPRAEVRSVTACRACGAAELGPVLALGETPLANDLPSPDDPRPPERYPLDLLLCPRCALLQLRQIVSPGRLFSEYLYFSSFSDTMLRHAEALADRLVRERRLGPDALVVEVASNDGYLLQSVRARGVPVLGIEPAANVARAAEAKGIPTLIEFFGRALAERLAGEGRLADAIVGNNVLAHVPEPNDFVAGVALLLKRDGLAQFEIPYAEEMLARLEFDTIYHEHQCYFSLTALDGLFRRHGLRVLDVEPLPIHGGSIRVSVGHRGEPSGRVGAMLDEEERRGAAAPERYRAFASSVEALRDRLVELLGSLRAGGARLAAYGAAAKGVTLTSYCGIDERLLDFVVDRSPHKQGRLFPVGRLPILPPSALLERRPDYALLLTWNFADEILEQQAAYRAAGGRFVLPVPTPRVV